MNTSFSYIYWDHAHQFHRARVVLQGPCTWGEIDDIYARTTFVRHGSAFLPQMVGIPSVQGEFDDILSDEPGTPWHHVDFIDSTDADATSCMTFAEVYRLFMEINGEWDVNKVLLEMGLDATALLPRRQVNIDIRLEATLDMKPQFIQVNIPEPPPQPGEPAFDRAALETTIATLMERHIQPEQVIVPPGMTPLDVTVPEELLRDNAVQGGNRNRAP